MRGLPNLELLTKSATTGKVEVTYVHASIGNKSLGETMIAFAFEVSLDAPTVVTINTEHDFTGIVDKICLPITKFILCAAVGNLCGSKKLRDWKSLNALLFLSFLTEAVLTKFRYQDS